MNVCVWFCFVFVSFGGFDSNGGKSIGRYKRNGTSLVVENHSFHCYGTTILFYFFGQWLSAASIQSLEGMIAHSPLDNFCLFFCGSYGCCFVYSFVIFGGALARGI